MTRSARQLAATITTMWVAACGTVNDGRVAHNPVLAQQAASDGIGEFALLHWGMRPNDMKRGYPGFYDAYEPRLTDAVPEPILRMDRYRAGQCVFRVTLRYVRTNSDGVPLMYDGLHAVDMELIEGDLSACRAAMAANLLDRYGPNHKTFNGDPIPSKDVSTSDFVEWQGPFTVASMRTSFGLARTLFGINYRDARYDANFLRPES